ncbi:MAG: hypothetical protein IJ654_04020 [Bacteroidales bacterium]|nr:hypothetical protein [Bacteroidales bacterium]
MGTYGYDKDFFAARGINTVELKSVDGAARVLMVPAWQGRVMTSTTGGRIGPSYGWINHDFIASGQFNPQFNSYGGEERFWIGPEGGPFSWFFPKGAEQVYAHWNVPSILDSDPFTVEAVCDTAVRYVARASLENASGRRFEIGFRREVSLVSGQEAESLLGVPLGAGVRAVVYRTDNSLTNEGSFAWSRETGMPSVWLLGCFNPTPTTTVFIPYDPVCPGRIVNDAYFGKVPSDRLKVSDGVVYFKIDGAFRSKIGLPAGSARDVCGSYDPVAGVLNILKYTAPSGPCDYVNSQWGEQEDAFGGDVINAYNDGPTETGVVMGPFFEIETSSPGAALEPGQTLTHTQYTMHLEGSPAALDPIARAVFGLSLGTVMSQF